MKRKGNIYPRYKQKTNNNLEIAQNLIEIYKDNIGKKKRTIKDHIYEFEEHDYRFIRGLSTLLDRRSTFLCKSSFDPIKIRQVIFEITGNLGPATNSKKRKYMLKEASKKLKLPINAI